MCDEVSSDELWYELIGVAKAMLCSSGASEETEAVHIWENLPVALEEAELSQGRRSTSTPASYPGEVMPPPLLLHPCHR